MVGQGTQKRKTALITGASSGIGAEFARILARQGCDLVLVARNKERLDALAEELGRNFGATSLVLAKDLSVRGAVEEIYSDLENKRVGIDILINNAGFGVYGPFLETKLTEEMEMLQVNIVSLTMLTKLFMRDMVSRGFGKILNIGSTGSFSPTPLSSVYCASKAYVLSFSEAIAEELTGTGVTVTTLCPGPTATGFAQRAQMAETKIFQQGTMTAKEVALTGYNAMMSGRPTVVAGMFNKIMVFSIRLSPRYVVTKMAKFLMSKQ